MEEAASEKVLCAVFRSRRYAGAYLFVHHPNGLGVVPADLLARFGEPEPALVLALTPTRKLAQARAEQVLAALDSHGYFLQMPPAPETAMAAVAARNEKLTQG